MRGSKAKRIRKLVYGDQSLRQSRDYVRLVTGQIINKAGSLRAVYQEGKRMMA